MESCKQTDGLSEATGADKFTQEEHGAMGRAVRREQNLVVIEDDREGMVTEVKKNHREQPEKEKKRKGKFWKEQEAAM